MDSSGDEDSTVRLWDPATGTPVGGPLAGHTDGIAAVAAVSLPGRRALRASGGNDTIIIWEFTGP